MNKINRNNYEIYFIDHFDGRLKATEESELHSFLIANPDLKAEFEEFEMIEVPKIKTSYPGKKILKKSIEESGPVVSDKNFDDYCIAYFEGDLKHEEQQALMLFLQKRPDLKKDFELYQKTSLQAPADISFSNKNKLKKSGTISWKLVYYSSAIAASLLLLFGILSLFDRNTSTIEQRTEFTLSYLSTHGTNKIESAGSGPVAYEIEPRNIIEKAAVNPVHYREALALSSIQPVSQQEEIHSDNVEDIYPIFLFQRFSPINIFQLHTEEYYASLEQKDKSLAGKILGNAFQGITSIFQKQVDEIYENGADEFNLWNLAEAGIEGYNVLADRDVKLLKQYNKKGELVGFALLGENIEYFKKLK